MPRVLRARSAGLPDGQGVLPAVSPQAPWLALSRSHRHVVAFVAVAVSYYLGARLGLHLSLVEDNVTPLWPPTGIAVAAFLLFGRSMWPAVAIAALAVNLPISADAL